ncbi:MAG: L-carnitine dehydratase/bile acid-inducible protein [Solirubrobacterales bacterium]|nr:L-carnitine dehydratase/bile acid-inducible protein [Solirubrobacterales bacterium]
MKAVDGPLDGLRVIELGTLLAGPFAGRLLADMGAEVIKVEAPDRPDPMRGWGQTSYRGRSLWWPVLARNKKCVTLDLRSPAGQTLLLELVAKSDVVIENFRPGTLERWNLGYEQLAAVNPGIVLARVSGYGQTGPYAARAGYAAAAEAMGGLRFINGYPDEPPPRAGISLGDSLAGMFAAQGVLAALYRRDHSPDGRGQVVDVSILEACFALLEGAVPEYDLLGHIRRPSGSRMPGVAPSNVFATADGRSIVIAANQDTLFRRLCGVMDRPELADDPRFAAHAARFENQDELEAHIAAWAVERTAEQVDGVLNAAGVVCAPIMSIADIFADEHVRAREMLVEHVDPELGSFTGPGVVPKFSRTPGGVRWTGPWTSGQDNAEVLGQLADLGDEDLAALAREGTI